MSETEEVQTPPEFSPEAHQAYANLTEHMLGERMGKIVNKALIGTGTVFALAGIGDFLTGGRVTAYISEYVRPESGELLHYLAHNFVNMPQYMHLIGGAALIGVSRYTTELLEPLKKK